MDFNMILVHVLSALGIFLLGYLVGTIRSDNHWRKILDYWKKQNEEARSNLYSYSHIRKLLAQREKYKWTIK